MPIQDPDIQPLDRTVKLRFSRRQLETVDQLAREFGMTRSWLLREALALGVPGCPGQDPGALRGWLPALRDRSPAFCFGSPTGTPIRRSTDRPLGPGPEPAASCTAQA